MTEHQQNWLAEHPKFEPVRPLGIVSLYGYTDEGYLLQSGDFVQGQLRNWGGLYVISSGDTLYTGVKDAIKVGRRFDLC